MPEFRPLCKVGQVLHTKYICLNLELWKVSPWKEGFSHTQVLFSPYHHHLEEIGSGNNFFILDRVNLTTLQCVVSFVSILIRLVWPVQLVGPKCYHILLN